MIALGYRFYLQDALELVRTEAAKRAEDIDTWGKVKAAQWDKVAKWADSLTLQQMLEWFDCIESVHVNNGRSRFAGRQRAPAETNYFSNFCSTSPRCIFCCFYAICMHCIFGEPLYKKIFKHPNVYYILLIFLLTCLRQI